MAQNDPVKYQAKYTLSHANGGYRMDFFCGAGTEAEHTAGFLNAQGAVYVLVKK